MTTTILATVEADALAALKSYASSLPAPYGPAFVATFTAIETPTLSNIVAAAEALEPAGVALYALIEAAQASDVAKSAEAARTVPLSELEPTPQGV